MAQYTHILTALKREFPAPPVKPAWVEECAAALLEDGQDASLENIRDQFLYSDLAISTVPISSIPTEAHEVELFPTPTLLQLVSITEIGSSAFQLQTVLEQRKEVLSGATRIRRMDDDVGEGEDGEGPAVDDEKLPKYPRGMLKLEVTDGLRVMKAMEYERLQGMQLGETCLGSKLVLHRVRALRGTLLLSPSNTKFLGYEVAHLEADQPTKFVNSLLRRMNKPVPGEDPATAQAQAPRRALPPPANIPRTAAPTRRLTVPPSSRTPATPGTATGNNNNGGSTRTRLPNPVASPYFSNTNATPSSSNRPSRTARSAAQERITTLYDQTAQLKAMSSASASAGPASARNRAQAARAAAIAEAKLEGGYEEEEEEEDDFDDSFFRQIDAVEAAATATATSATTTTTVGRGQQILQRQGGGGVRDDEDDDEDDDDDWFAEVDVDALERAYVSGPTSSGRARAGRDKENVAPRGRYEQEVIEISD